MIDLVSAKVLLQAFHNWGPRDKRLKATYAKVEKVAFEVVEVAFLELDDPKPGTFQWWWTRQHMRFKVKDEQMRLVHELANEFLTKYARGTLQDDIASSKTNKRSKRARGPTEVIGEGQHDTWGKNS